MTTGKNRYEQVDHLGEGQYANVYKARDKLQDGKIVAVKKIKLGTRTEAKDGVNRTALREIKLLQELSHENLIGLLDVFGHKSNISLVFDFMDTDLEQLINDTTLVFLPSHVKNIMIQTLTGLEYLHDHWILHRDLKPNNLLLNEAGVLKIADFGLARFFGSPNRIYTCQVVTRWYRAPELLLGARNYGTGVDVWAIGCILAELLRRAPLFPGESDLDQLSKIIDILGSPNDWPNMEMLPDYVAFKPCPAVPLNSIFLAADDDLIELLQKCLIYNPLKRCTCSQALQLSYFSKKPYPCNNSDLPVAKQNEPSKRYAGKRKRIDETNINASTRKKLHF